MTRRRRPKVNSDWARVLKDGYVQEWNQARRDHRNWRPDLQHYNLKRARIPGANLRRAFLQYANFSGCDLTGADLRDAVVTFAQFSGAILTRANLRGAKNLSRAQLESVLEAAEVLVDPILLERPTIPGAAPSVFLSYAHEDRIAVLAVDQWLREKGARVFLDERHFVAGENIRDEILRWIEQAGVIVCFISRHSSSRPYPKLEREIAEIRRGAGTHVIYFNLDDTVLDSLHKARLYVPAFSLSFDESCDMLWRGIVRSARPASPVDLEPFRAAGTSWAAGNPEAS